MSSLLDAAFASWTRHLTERGFDSTFLSLLRAAQFFDVHFTHGVFEFGKDVIAKLPAQSGDHSARQYAFQLKAGDIGAGEWAEIVGQLHELTDAYLTHPNFDKSLPRNFVLVTTGELKGKAPLAARAFAEEVQTRSLGTFTTWELPNLLEMLSGRGLMPLAPSLGLETAVGAISSRETADHELEALLAPLVPRTLVRNSEAHRALLDNAICANALLERGRAFQGLTAVANSVRIAAVQSYEDADLGSDLLADALDLFVTCGDVVLGDLLRHPSDSEAWIRWLGGSGRIVAYQTACLRTVEFLGLRALHERHHGDDASFIATTRLLATIFDSQPGVMHPISDRYAASLAPPVLALAAAGDSDRAERWIVGATKWVCDRYERSEAGLAAAHGTAEEEVRTLLGYPFEAIDLPPRRESLLAVALADLAYSACPRRFPDIVNDLLAVRIVPAALHARDSTAGCFVGGGDTVGLLNIKYPEHTSADRLPHALLQRDARVPERLGGVAAQLTLACICRDRLFSDCYPRVVGRDGR